MDVPFGLGTDGDLVHVHVGSVEKIPAIGNGHDGDRVPQALGDDVRPLERVDGHVYLRVTRPANPQRLTDVEHRRFVELPFADHDDAVHGNRVKHGAHCRRRRVVRLVFLSPTHPARCGNGRRLRHADEFQRQAPVHGLSPCFLPCADFLHARCERSRSQTERDARSQPIVGFHTLPDEPKRRIFAFTTALIASRPGPRYFRGS